MLLTPDQGGLPAARVIVATAEAWASALQQLNTSNNDADHELLVTGMELSVRQGFDPRAVDTTAWIKGWDTDTGLRQRIADLLIRTTFNINAIDVSHLLWLIGDCSHTGVIAWIRYFLHRVAAGREELTPLSVDFCLAAFDRLQDEIGGGGCEDEVLELFSPKGLLALLRWRQNFGPVGLIEETFLGEDQICLSSYRAGVAGISAFLSTALYPGVANGNSTACALANALANFQRQATASCCEAIRQGRWPEYLADYFDSLALNGLQGEFLGGLGLAIMANSPHCPKMRLRKELYVRLSGKPDEPLTGYYPLMRFLCDSLTPEASPITVRLAVEAVFFAPARVVFGHSYSASLASRALRISSRADLPLSVRTRALGIACKLAVPERYPDDKKPRIERLRQRSQAALSALCASNEGAEALKFLCA